MNYDRAAMKEEVKQAMRQTQSKPMLVTLLFLVIVGIGSSLISWLVNALLPGYNTLLNELIEYIQYYGEDYFEYVVETNPELFLQLMGQMMIQAGVVSLVAGILTTVWSGLMDAGYAGYCLDMSRGSNPKLDRIFSGFPRAGSVILSYVLVAVFTFLWGLLFSVGLGVLLVIALVIVAASDSMAVIGVLLMVAATVGYIIAMIWVTFRYAMVPFAVIDSQTPMSAMDAINTSKTLMKGRKGSYFVLQISFIGWYLLEFLIALVGVIISAISLFAIASSFISDLSYAEYVTILEGNYDFTALALQLLGPVLIVALLCSVGIFIFRLWLTPYRTGCNARFYTYAMGSAQLIPPGPSGGQPGAPYGGQPDSSDGQPDPSGGQPGAPYGGQPDPYNYTPPSQGSFGGYPRPEQPPRHDGSGYPQWGAPQAPFVPPAEPPLTPSAPEAPDAPEDPDDAPYEAPYSEPDDPGDDMPQQPGGPNYPQY